MIDFVFISLDQVLDLHGIGLRPHGGRDGLRDPGYLASVIAQAEATWYDGNGDLADIASAYAYPIAQNQPFIDGNKRAAMGTALTLLEVNGVDTTNFDEELLYDAMIGVAEKRLTKADPATPFRNNLSP